MFLRYSVEKELTRKINVKVKESDEFQYAAKTYELCGFTVHTGASGNSGHYRAYRVSGVVYDDHGGASEPTLRKISSEGLEKQKENGYIYLYKKKSRPSKSRETELDERQLQEEGDGGCLNLKAAMGVWC